MQIEPHICSSAAAIFVTLRKPKAPQIALLRKAAIAWGAPAGMYFYTELKSEGGRAPGGCQSEHRRNRKRQIRLNELNPRLTTDEIVGLFYAARGDHLFADSFDR